MYFPTNVDARFGVCAQGGVHVHARGLARSHLGRCASGMEGIPSVVHHQLHASYWRTREALVVHLERYCRAFTERELELWTGSKLPTRPLQMRTVRSQEARRNRGHTRNKTDTPCSPYTNSRNKVGRRKTQPMCGTHRKFKGKPQPQSSMRSARRTLRAVV